MPARQLAAGKRWIAEGGPPVWAATFMEQAQAILSFDTFASQRWDSRRPSRKNVFALEHFAFAFFPEKVLRVTTPEQVRILRRVRALPQQQAPGPSIAEGPGA